MGRNLLLSNAAGCTLGLALVCGLPGIETSIATQDCVGASETRDERAGKDKCARDAQRDLADGFRRADMPGRGPHMGHGHRGRHGMHLPQRHHTYMSGNVPAEFRKPENTVGYTVQAIANGARIYSDQCAQCHGKKGEGDGPAARYLDPPPSSLSFTVNHHIGSDGFLLWSIALGGKAFDTQMPAFDGVLTRSQMWEVIAYMRAGFPELKKESSGHEGKQR